MQFVMNNLEVNELGSLSMSGCNLVDIAKEYGTPVYVMDETAIRNNCRVYINAMQDYYGGNGLILYASKALSCKYIYKVMKEERMGVDVVSGGELYTALKADFPPEKIYFHGNNKTEEELDFALKNGVGCIVVDNSYELEILNKLAEDKNKCAEIMFRIKPGIDAHTHSFVRTGQIDSKFGVALETGEAEEIIKKAAEMKNIKVIGVHCHIGSQIFELAPFEMAAQKMIDFMADMKDKYNVEMDKLNLGGGYGIKYTKEDKPIDYDKFINAVSDVVKERCDARNFKLPFLLMEPGRSIVAPAGLTLYTVGCVKNIPGIRTYVSVDGGMGDNPRFIMYGSEYEAVMVEKPEDKPTQTVTISGKCCESGDILIQDAKMPDIYPGELLAVLATGAYNYSMASNYNRIPRPPIVMLKDGKSILAVKRESYEDLIINDL